MEVICNPTLRAVAGARWRRAGASAMPAADLLQCAPIQGHVSLLGPQNKLCELQWRRRCAVWLSFPGHQRGLTVVVAK
ncbi:hypothetical protein T11_8479 [Trichinella zimbabwensis]|uniref:Uncharacterized protein n=1 Tax=Trichinella zimbabwensis TaxID=268475 RepID=A0A0V1HDW3_9BILA|nr:hypothetical protein T11_8479 [Trichinella zimbabwensis]